MRVLIADSLKESAVTELEKIGCTVSMRYGLTAEELPREISGFQVLVVRSTKVTEETIIAADQLALVVRAGAGVNTIALKAAARAGIYVANCPGKNANAVAELAFGLIIAADRRIVDATKDLRAGSWRKKHYQKAGGLFDRKLGIVGYGGIGRAVARIAQGMGMRVVAWSRSLSDEVAEGDAISVTTDLMELAHTCDVVSIHLASNSETRNLIGTHFFDAMKDGSIFINTSRGDIVDTYALKIAIDEKEIKVGLDVFVDEPGSGTADFTDTELANLVTATPHIGASTAQASEAIAAETVRVIRLYKETGLPANVVNVSLSSKAAWVFVVRHQNHVGVLAGVLDELRGADVNIEEMQNTVFEGGVSACCTMLLDSLPDEKTVARIQAADMVYAARIESKGAGITP